MLGLEGGAAWNPHISHISYMHPKPFPPPAKDVRSSPHRHPPTALPGPGNTLFPAGPSVPLLARGDNLLPATVLGPCKKSAHFKELLGAANIRTRLWGVDADWAVRTPESFETSSAERGEEQGAVEAQSRAT